ncbi:MAG: hypothetical protein K8J08_07575 [Thermoanaerobaculia bacterium]|nr:hypothetical protein [Thermoanaerobaculia bacterium]
MEPSDEFGSKFLQAPDLFPARFSGTQWGDLRLGLGFVGGPYVVEGLSTDQVVALRERFADLCGEPKEGALRLQVFRVDQSDFREITEFGWEYSLDLRYRANRVDLAGLELMASLQWRPDLEAALWTYVADGEVFAGTLENVFRALVAYRLAATGGALLHSAGVLDNGQARLFLGRSGAGKTTLSTLSAASGRQVLSDDLNAVSWEDGLPVVYQMPFSGDFGQAERVPGAFPLVEILRLEKGSTGQRRDASPAEAFGALAACATAVGRDPFRSASVMETLQRLASEVPVSTLTFTKDGDPWTILT